MAGEYRSLLANVTWDLVPLPKGIKFVRCKWFIEQILDQMEKWINIKLVLLLNDFHNLRTLTTLKPCPLFPVEIIQTYVYQRIQSDLTLY